MRERDLYRLVLAAVLLLAACEEPDLSEALSKGRCDSQGRCAQGYQCVNGDCVKPDAAGQAGAGPCDGGCDPATEACCNDQCFRVQDDPEHCGSCTTKCPNTVCANRFCQNPPGGCAPGFLDCDMNVINGCEVEGSSCPADAGKD